MINQIKQIVNENSSWTICLNNLCVFLVLAIYLHGTTNFETSTSKI